MSSPQDRPRIPPNLFLPAFFAFAHRRFILKASRRLPPNAKMGTAMNDREFRKYLQEIAQSKVHQDRPPVQEPPQGRERQAQKELPTKKVPDKAGRSTGRIGALKVRRKA